MAAPEEASPSSRESDQSGRFQRVWLLTFVSLFLTLLAFFIVLISQVILEGVPEKRAYQLMLQDLTQAVQRYAHEEGLDWLRVENAFPKGVRLYPDPALFADQPLFYSARAQLNPRFIPYLREIARFLHSLDVPAFDRVHTALLRPVHRKGLRVQLTLRVEGHTDATPPAPNAPYPDNVTLSVFRAHAVMKRLQALSAIPPRYWAIAGYGAWHPLFPDPMDPRNRRVELYLQPQLIKAEGETDG
ncbi:chemotaxis protein MotB [Sulfurivirga caldicuralii]|uniref:Chemotaxis protein MotB n=1 Tax=Sulfurivirga caldicuralii TaxID=364032 RepID=A0A1N6GL33_9GAMM|nr:OmpA family protein [Sulfurivirga caldicuralii]SIO08112.1 chemotaxis protein MotB [Sulfurivirga caldicuralii]